MSERSSKRSHRIVGPELPAKATVRSEPLCSFHPLGMAAVAREGKQLDARNCSMV
jgi:hypothetical protein